MTVEASEEFAPLREAVHDRERQTTTLRELRWPGNARIAVNFTADFDAMLLRRLLNEPAMQLTKGEFGGRVGIWRLIELYASHGIKSTIFTPGRIAELYPESVKAAAKAGHEIADHMWEHRVPREPAIERIHLERTAAALERLTGRRPVGTRSGHSPELLQELGFIYDSYRKADQLPYLEAVGGRPFVSLPFHYAIDDAMFFNFAWFDSPNSAQRITDTDRVFELWWAAFLQQYEWGGYFNICIHPEVSGRSLRIAMLDKLISKMKQMPGVWFATCEEVARHCLAHDVTSAKRG